MKKTPRAIWVVWITVVLSILVGIPTYWYHFNHGAWVQAAINFATVIVDIAVLCCLPRIVRMERELQDLKASCPYSPPA